MHALTTLNDPTWVEAARILAERVSKENKLEKDQLEKAFWLILCRAPKESERQRLLAAYEKQKRIFSADPEGAKKLLAIGASTADEQLNAVHHAALTSVCLAMLNLDEALTRE